MQLFSKLSFTDVNIMFKSVNAMVNWVEVWHESTCLFYLIQRKYDFGSKN